MTKLNMNRPYSSHEAWVRQQHRIAKMHGLLAIATTVILLAFLIIYYHHRLASFAEQGPGTSACYTVQTEDTHLTSVAEKTLGNGDRWPEIAKLNRLGEGKSYRAGDCLKIPAE